jgi:hypothetical protein
MPSTQVGSTPAPIMPADPPTGWLRQLLAYRSAGGRCCFEGVVDDAMVVCGPRDATASNRPRTP